jgi:hypothetical protein
LCVALDKSEKVWYTCTMKRKRKAIKNRARGTPCNYSFWRLVVSKEAEVLDFIKRGDARQKGCIRDTLEYIKRIDPYYYKKIKGKIILEKLRKTI